MVVVPKGVHLYKGSESSGVGASKNRDRQLASGIILKDFTVDALTISASR